MKKTLTLLFALVLGCMTVNAVPAKSGVKRTVTLADGTKVELTLRGDEFYSFYQGNDGFAYRQKNNQFERFSLEEASKEWKSRMTRANKERKSKTRGVGESATYIGKKKGLVILMQFKDLDFVTENVLDVYKDFFNKENYTDNGMTGSVKDYFKAQSYNQFELDFDVVGPFTSRDSMAYYGKHYTDKDGNEHNDSHPQTLAYEACLQADSLVNFADYDWDGDGEVDQVFVIYAGYAEAQGAAPETIWPHEWGLASGGYSNVMFDGVKVDTYACAAELCYAEGANLDGIGTACHEFSHCLGLPDMYDTDYSGGYGMSYWDVMHAGSYLNDAKTPAGYTSYERMFSGWLTPTELNGDMTQISNMKALVDSPEAYILYNEGNKNEYYLLENRQNKGFDGALYGHGLLVLHVDYDKNTWLYNAVNDDPNHQRCTIIPADNNFNERYFNEIAGDAFPGPTKNTTLNNYSTPAATLFNANVDGRKLMSKAIDHITESEDGLISFVALRPEMPTPSIAEAKETEGEGSFTITWPAVDGAIGYQLELTEKPAASSNPSEALEREFNFDEFVSKTTGFSDVSTKMLEYGFNGWSGSKIYTSPNKMKIGTSTASGYVRTATWDVPNSAEFTVVMGAGLVKADTPVNGTVIAYTYNKGDATAQGEKQSFELTEDGKLVFNFTTDKGLFWLNITPEAQMYLNYLGIYDGIWNASQLGLGASSRSASTRAAKISIYETDTNSITLTDLNTSSRYTYRIRTLGEDDNISGWSDEKSFQFSSSGIANILFQNNSAPQRVYDLNGRCVGTNLNALPKGVYIIDGKKVVK